MPQPVPPTPRGTESTLLTISRSVRDISWGVRAALTLRPMGWALVLQLLPVLEFVGLSSIAVSGLHSAKCISRGPSILFPA